MESSCINLYGIFIMTQKDMSHLRSSFDRIRLYYKDVAPLEQGFNLAMAFLRDTANPH